jgi:hypothetical protein
MMHLCAKYDANRTIRPRVIQMAPNVTNRVTDRQTDRHTQVITIPSKRLFQRRFAVKTDSIFGIEWQIYQSK